MKDDHGFWRRRALVLGGLASLGMPLAAAAAERPPGFADVSRATCLLTALDPPHRLEFTWPGVGEVSIRLADDMVYRWLGTMWVKAPRRTAPRLTATGRARTLPNLQRNCKLRSPA